LPARERSRRAGAGPLPSRRGSRHEEDDVVDRCRCRGSHVQSSGGAEATVFTLTTTAPDRLAGKVTIDDSKFGGGKIVADFDLSLFKTFKK
jgi:hypothetical protein